MAFVARPDTSIRAMDGDLTQERRSEGLQAHFAEHMGSMRRMITARLGSQDDAEDLLQELWIKLADVHSGPVASPKAYLHKMALNLANDLVRERVRRRKRQTSWSHHMVAEADTVAIDPSPSPEQQLSDRIELAALLAAIRSLPERAQLVFRRHRLDGLSHGEVARELGISKSAVEKNMATAMKHLLRTKMDGDGI